MVTVTGFPDEPVSMNYGGSMKLSFLRMLVGEICANRGEFGLNLKPFPGLDHCRFAQTDRLEGIDGGAGFQTDRAEMESGIEEAKRFTVF